MILLTAATPRLAAQDWIFQRLNLDKLQVTSLGASVGHIVPSQVEGTTIYGLQADYGNVSPTWRLVFTTSYWESKYKDAVVQAFVDTLSKSLSNPSDRVAASKITLYDVTLGSEIRYTPDYSGEIKPFFGVGFAAHIINAEGKLIKGTFVERSLDDIAAGLFLTAGIALKLTGHVGVEGGVRGDLLSGFRSTQAHAGAAYYFGHVRGERRGSTNGSPNSR